MTNRILKIFALVMVIGLFSACSKEYYNDSFFYPDDFAVDVVNVYSISPDAIKVDFEVTNISSLDYIQGPDGNYFVEFGIRSSYGDEFYGETRIGTLYSGEYLRASTIIRVDPRAVYNLNNITYDVYDADGY
jgi:hypothetical protein